jgi:hypothetical protein
MNIVRFSAAGVAWREKGLRFWDVGPHVIQIYDPGTGTHVTPAPSHSIPPNRLITFLPLSLGAGITL